ncbi:(d)CMP kinase [Sandaracinobacteroides hominis]|uniref:(d)CMP kinase n=1 Tax=Sandaracinobacteroides hominis TaxID=2780086 RepID=UPI0018F40B8B|nr:(d)CMP kinase [Sandaracinobacteroides hominis]
MPLIAVDGPAASGKGTIARALGRHFGVPHLDTGALYRVVALSANRAGVALDDGAAVGRRAAAIDLSLLEDHDLRAAHTGEAASRVSAHPEVRAALMGFQRAFAAQAGGAVLDGRDIGTVIAPDAHAKLYVTAAPEVRARRRFLELTSAGRDVTEAGILADIVARDARDMGRTDAPLRQADDADLLDTSNLDIAAAVRAAIDLVSKRLERVP